MSEHVNVRVCGDEIVVLRRACADKTIVFFFLACYIDSVENVWTLYDGVTLFTVSYL